MPAKGASRQAADSSTKTRPFLTSEEACSSHRGTSLFTYHRDRTLPLDELIDRDRVNRAAAAQGLAQAAGLRDTEQRGALTGAEAHRSGGRAATRSSSRRSDRNVPCAAEKRITAGHHRQVRRLRRRPGADGSTMAAGRESRFPQYEGDP